MYALDDRCQSRRFIFLIIFLVLFLSTGCASSRRSEDARILLKLREIDIKIDKLEIEAEKLIQVVLDDQERQTYRFAEGVKSQASSLILHQNLVGFAPQLSRIAKLEITKDDEVRAFQDAIAVSDALWILQDFDSPDTEELCLARLVCGEDGLVMSAAFRNLSFLKSWNFVPKALSLLSDCREAAKDELVLQSGLEYVLKSNAMPTESCDQVASLKDLYREELKHPYSTLWQQIENNFDLLLQRHCTD